MDTKQCPGAKLEKGEALRARGQGDRQTDPLCVEAWTDLFSLLSRGPRAAAARHGPVGEGRPLWFSWVWAYLEEDRFSLGAPAPGPRLGEGGNHRSSKAGPGPSSMKGGGGRGGEQLGSVGG